MGAVLDVVKKEVLGNPADFLAAHLPHGQGASLSHAKWVIDPRFARCTYRSLPLNLHVDGYNATGTIAGGAGLCSPPERIGARGHPHAGMRLPPRNAAGGGSCLGFDDHADFTAINYRLEGHSQDHPERHGRFPGGRRGGSRGDRLLTRLGQAIARSECGGSAPRGRISAERATVSSG